MQMNCMHIYYSSDFIHSCFCFLFPFMDAEELEPNQSLLRGGVHLGQATSPSQTSYFKTVQIIKSLSKL